MAELKTLDDRALNDKNHEESNTDPQQSVDEGNDQKQEKSSTRDGNKDLSKTLCGICEINPSKYKCPRCFLPYCSVACNKIHRESHAGEPEPAPKPAAPLPPPVVSKPHKDGIKSDNPFHVLEHSEQLQYLFKKYPRLREQLEEIHSATMEPPSAKSKIPASLLKGLPDKGDGWNRDKAIASGKEALRKARKASGEDGDAIREYSELVLHFMDSSKMTSTG